MLKKLLIFLFLYLLFPSNVAAQVVINEVNPSEEWVELYNLEQSSTSLANCYLHLHQENYSGQKIIFSENDTVEKFKLVQKGDYNWSSNWLKDNQDQVILKCADFSDMVDYGEDSASGVEEPTGKSLGRNPDGTGHFYILESSTPGSENSSIAPPTATPTLKPTSTPKTAEVKSAQVNYEEKTIHIQPTISKQQPQKFEVTGTISASQSAAELVLGIQSTFPNDQQTASESSTVQTQKNKNPLLIGVIVLGGLSFIGSAAYPVLKKYRMGYTFRGDD
jgi:hypothetical protein